MLKNIRLVGRQLDRDLCGTSQYLITRNWVSQTQVLGGCTALCTWRQAPAPECNCRETPKFHLRATQRFEIFSIPGVFRSPPGCVRGANRAPRECAQSCAQDQTRWSCIEEHDGQHKLFNRLADATSGSSVPFLATFWFLVRQVLLRHGSQVRILPRSLEDL